VVKAGLHSLAHPLPSVVQGIKDVLAPVGSALFDGRSEAHGRPSVRKNSTSLSSRLFRGGGVKLALVRMFDLWCCIFSKKLVEQPMPDCPAMAYIMGFSLNLYF
jgi:hypothetical protein